MKKLFLFLIFTVFINTNLFAVSYSSSCTNDVCQWEVIFDDISIDSKMCSQYYEKSSEDLTELEDAKQFICYMQDFKGVNYNAFDDFQLYKLESLVLEIFVDDILTESENESIDAYKTFAFSSDRFVSYVNQRESKKINEGKDVKNIPKGARFSTQSRGWECDDLHYRNNDSTRCIKIPPNAIKLGKSNFECNSSTRKSSENECVYYELKNKQVKNNQSAKQNKCNKNDLDCLTKLVTKQFKEMQTCNGPWPGVTSEAADWLLLQCLQEQPRNVNQCYKFELDNWKDTMLTFAKVRQQGIYCK